MLQIALKLTRNLRLQWYIQLWQKSHSLSGVDLRTCLCTIGGLSFAAGVPEQYRGAPCFSKCAVHACCVRSSLGRLSVCGTVMESFGWGLFIFLFFNRADVFAGVWAVASVALRGPAIYQTEAESAGSKKGKKHALLCRLTPPLFFSRHTPPLSLNLRTCC